MPFTNHANRAFTLVSVEKNAPAASGVYGLSNNRQWIYVGETADIQAELLMHIRYPHEFLRDHSPSGFTYELSSAEHRIERQNRLIFELEPLGNRLVGQLSTRPSLTRAAQNAGFTEPRP